MLARKTRHVDAKEFCRLLQHLRKEDSTHSAGRRNFVFVLRRLQESLHAIDKFAATHQPPLDRVGEGTRW